MQFRAGEWLKVTIGAEGVREEVLGRVRRTLDFSLTAPYPGTNPSNWVSLLVGPIEALKELRIVSHTSDYPPNYPPHNEELVEGNEHVKRTWFKVSQILKIEQYAPWYKEDPG